MFSFLCISSVDLPLGPSPVAFTSPSGTAFLCHAPGGITMSEAGPMAPVSIFPSQIICEPHFGDLQVVTHRRHSLKFKRAAFARKAADFKA